MSSAIVIRAIDDAHDTARLLRERGIEPLLRPLSQVSAVPFAPPPGRFDGVLLGSVNTVRFAGQPIAAPAYAVGKRTARAARDAGWNVVWTGKGGLQAAIDALPVGRAIRLLRPHGSDPAELNLPDGVSVAGVPVYEVSPLSIGADFPAEGVVLVHSGSAARHLAAEVDRGGLSRNRYALACLAPGIGQAAGSGWAACEVASGIDDEALVELAVRLCHKHVP